MTRKQTRSQAGRPTKAGGSIILSSLPEDPIDRLLAANPVLVRLAHEITKHQRLLKGACSEEAWRIYLRIEELMNERMFSFADKWTHKFPR